MTDDTKGAAIIEAVGLRVTGDPETEAHASLRISFLPEAGEQTLTISYRPAANPGDEPEMELHGFVRWSDRSLKRDIRAI